MKDPYAELIKKMRTQGAKYNPPSIDIGIVVSDNPLTIKIGNLQLTKDNILVADFLLSNYKRKISIPSTNATGTAEDKSISSIAIPDGELSFTDGLKKDDMVACLATSNEQTYILLCRVVKL